MHKVVDLCTSCSEAFVSPALHHTSDLHGDGLQRVIVVLPGLPGDFNTPFFTSSLPQIITSGVCVITMIVPKPSLMVFQSAVLS